MKESLEIVATHEPAWSFATAAASWAEKAKSLQGPFYIGEPARLALIYSALSLEAFVDEQLVRRVPEPQYAPLYRKGLSLTQRWEQAAALLVTPDPDSQAALGRLKSECQDKGNYGLLVRARNKLVHPRVHIEVFDEAGHAIKSGTLENLIKDLQTLSWYPAGIQPAFPHAVECLASADWSVTTLEDLVQLWYRVVGEALPERWRNIREQST